MAFTAVHFWEIGSWENSQNLHENGESKETCIETAESRIFLKPGDSVQFRKQGNIEVPKVSATYVLKLIDDEATHCLRNER
jgi:hypothetical protein